MQPQQRLVDFVVRGINDLGLPSQALLEVTEVAVVDAQGRMVRRFRDAESLSAYLARKPVRGRLIAVETVGLPRFDLIGRYSCYEQGLWDSLPKT